MQKEWGSRGKFLEEVLLMKIAIPIESKDLEGKICPSFGRTPCFLLYETDSKKEEDES